MDVLGYATSLLGGALIGLAASLHLFTHGRVTGISGILAGSMSLDDPAWRTRVAFVGGLVATGGIAALIAPSAFGSQVTTSAPLLVAAGLLVGVGTRIGSGCTSGHGVCGLSRLSIRSLVAVMTFMAAGMLTVAVVRHALGGLS
jgi:uncharacterized membrane protein YedE/YeeE